ncbi:interaptin-like [Mytilus edulis]|uniref:interaptin-like n=1 Tax=Mytilus edulis TaxID=6550 RepID=UPI0039F015B0
MSRMYFNQVSSRELFNGRRDKRNSQISDNGSQQLYQNSQIEFSENSQDATYSQPLSGDSESQSQGTQGRRVFDRFMTKRTNSETSFRSTPATKPSNGYNPAVSLPVKQQIRSNFQQQVLMNKTKAKERDDREMYESVVNTVKECSDEMRGSIKMFQQNMEQMSDVSHEKFSAMTNSVFDVLNDNFKKMIETMQDRDQEINKMQDLEREIFVRDAKIEELNSMMEKQQAEKENQIVDSLRSVMTSLHQETIGDLKKIGDTVMLNTNNQCQLKDSHKQQKDLMEKHYHEYKNIQSVRHEDIKRGVMNELQQLRQDLESHTRQLEDFYCKELSTTHYKGMKEIQYHISTGLEKHTHQSRDDSREMCNYQINEIKGMCKYQQEAHKTLMKTQMQEQAMIRKHENEQLAKQIEMITLKTMSEISNKQTSDRHTQNSIPNTVTKGVQEQLDKMFERYNEDFSKMRTQMETVAAKKNSYFAESAIEPVSDENSVQRSQDISSKVSTIETNRISNILSDSNRNFQYNDSNKKNFTFVSPSYRGDMWNTTKSLFSKTNPSPVAAVIPQPQINENFGNKKQPVRENNKKSRRKKRTHGEPSRKSQRLNRTCSDVDYDTSDASQTYRLSQDLQAVRNDSEREKNQRSYSSLLPLDESQIRNNGMCMEKQQGKQVDVRNTNSSVFKQPFSQISHKDSDHGFCNFVSNRSENIGAKVTPFSTNSMSREKQLTQFEKVLPVRPNTYSSGNLRRSTPSVINSLQPVRRFSQHRDSQSINTHNKLNHNSALQQKNGSVYDFNDSPAGSTRTVNEIKQRDRYTVNRQESATESSRESSPSLSITKIMIQRKVKNRKRQQTSTPLQKDGIQTLSQRKEDISDDFLSTPNVEDTQNTSDNWERQSVMSGYSRRGEKRRLYNFDIGQELIAIKKAFHV